MFSCRGKFVFFQPTQHSECVLVDRAWFASPPDGIPSFPVDLKFWCFGLELVFESGLKLFWSEAELAFAMEHRDLSMGRAKPFDGFAPGTVQGFGVDAGLEPAPPVQEVIALLHEHLPQAVPQHL